MTNHMAPPTARAKRNFELFLYCILALEVGWLLYYIGTYGR